MGLGLGYSVRLGEVEVGEKVEEEVEGSWRRGWRGRWVRRLAWGP